MIMMMIMMMMVMMMIMLVMMMIMTCTYGEIMSCLLSAGMQSFLNLYPLMYLQPYIFIK